MKPSLPHYCVTTLMRSWTSSQRGEGHHCPSIWVGAALILRPVVPPSLPLIIHHLLPHFLYNSFNPLCPPSSTSIPRHQPLHPFYALLPSSLPHLNPTVRPLCPMAAAAKAGRVNGQANEFSPSANCGVRTHSQNAHTRSDAPTYMHPHTNIHSPIACTHSERHFH